jgi:hypothetical protein
MLRGPSGCSPGSNRALPVYRAPIPRRDRNQADEKLPPMKWAALDHFRGGYGSEVNDQEAEQIPAIPTWIRNGTPGFPQCFATNRVRRQS